MNSTQSAGCVSYDDILSFRDLEVILIRPSWQIISISIIVASSNFYSIHIKMFYSSSGHRDAAKHYSHFHFYSKISCILKLHRKKSRKISMETVSLKSTSICCIEWCSVSIRSGKKLLFSKIFQFLQLKCLSLLFKSIKFSKKICIV